MYVELSEALLGILLGLTGLIPFIHANTVVELTENIAFKNFGLFAVTLVFTRVCFEFLAAVKFGISSVDNVLTLKNLSEKNNWQGKEALKEMCIHCIGAMTLSLFLFPFYSIAAPVIEKIVSPATPIILAGIFTWFIATQDNKINALIVAGLAGAVGVIIFEKNIQNSLFILLTGLYAIPVLLSKGEKQEKGKEEKTNFFPLLIIIGSAIGMSSAFLPAMTPTMLTVIALCFLEKKNTNEFIVLNSSIIGGRTVSDFAAVEFLSKGRSGATAKILENNTFDFAAMYAYISLGIVIAIASSLIAWKIYEKIPSEIMNAKFKIIALILIFAYVFYTSGFIGIIALSVCSLVGLTCSELNIGKAILGTSILFPSIRNYL